MAVIIQVLTFIHILLISVSNILVQYPFTINGIHTTWGAFTYPLIFIVTDLTTRLLGKDQARSVIFTAMVPSLIISYILALIFSPDFSINNYKIQLINILALRIALACFMAYTLGQLLDITIFQKLRYARNWWLAPLASLIIGNILDTYLFFFLAFYHCDNPVLSSHWPEIAFVDTCAKLVISIICFLPLYGIALSYFKNILKNQFSNYKQINL